MVQCSNGHRASKAFLNWSKAAIRISACLRPAGARPAIWRTTKYRASCREACGFEEVVRLETDQARLRHSDPRERVTEAPRGYAPRKRPRFCVSAACAGINKKWVFKCAGVLPVEHPCPKMESETTGKWNFCAVWMLLVPGAWRLGAGPKPAMFPVFRLRSAHHSLDGSANWGRYGGNKTGAMAV